MYYIYLTVNMEWAGIWYTTFRSKLFNIISKDLLKFISMYKFVDNH